MSKLKDIAKSIARINPCGGCSGGPNKVASSIITKQEQRVTSEPGRESCYVPSNATRAIRNVSQVNPKVLDTRYVVRRRSTPPGKSRHPFPKIYGATEGRSVVVCNDCTDIMINVGVNKKNLAEEDGGDNYYFSQVLLPPILMKPKQSAVKKKEPEGFFRNQRSSAAMQRLKTRAENFPVSGDKHHQRKNNNASLLLSESFAMVKSSSDPHGDFRESMVEMIVKNNIRSGGELEELLACYLSLNSGEYHDLIVKVFGQIWADLNDLYNT